MKRARSILLAALCVVPLATVASADLCPPLPVKAHDTCECAVQNYGAKDDGGVTIELYDSQGVRTTCGPLTIGAGRSEACAAVYELTENCGCAVRGQNSNSRTSLSVETAAGQSAQASVECR